MFILLLIYFCYLYCLHKSTLAPGCPVCFSKFKKYENTSKKSEKIGHKHTQVMNTRENFQQKITNFLLCAKKTNFCPKMRYKKYVICRYKEHAKLLRWHMEDRKKDDKLRHPADGRQWRKIEREFGDFAVDARNLWFGLSTDDMNPFGEQSCSHSTWPLLYISTTFLLSCA